MIFENFLEDMGQRPIGKSLDRYPNYNGNYEPANCRWATTQEQASNKRTNRLITFKGETLILLNWAQRLGISPQSLKKRLKKWPFDYAMTCGRTDRAWKKSKH